MYAGFYSGFFFFRSRITSILRKEAGKAREKDGGVLAFSSSSLGLVSFYPFDLFVMVHTLLISYVNCQYVDSVSDCF